MTGPAASGLNSSKVADQRRTFEQLRLSDHAYQQRRAMLIVAAITFAISWGGVRPSEIDLAGIKIGEWQESLLLSFSALILSYLIGNFALVAKPEFETWSDEFERFKPLLSKTAWKLP
jgi:hypothetical protein